MDYNFECKKLVNPSLFIIKNILNTGRFASVFDVVTVQQESIYATEYPSLVIKSISLDAQRCADSQTALELTERIKNEIRILMLLSREQKSKREKKTVEIVDFYFDNSHSHVNLIMSPRLDSDLYQARVYEAQPITRKRWKNLTIQMFQAVLFIHKLGVVHNDLKPENILYDAVRGRLLLADFGSAVFLRDDNEIQTHFPSNRDDNNEEAESPVNNYDNDNETEKKKIHTDEETIAAFVGGTWLFMAPELALRLPNSVSFQSDLFSCALVSLWLHTPGSFRGARLDLSQTSPAQMQQIAQRGAYYLSARTNQITPAAQQCLHRCLSFEPKSRPTLRDALLELECSA